MKNKKFLLPALAGLVTFFSCKKENPSQAETEEVVTFSGTITHPNSDSLMVFNKNYKKRITVSDGKFHDTLHIKEKGMYRFYDGVEQSALYLTKGDQLQLTLDTEAFDETIVYEGKGADINNFLAQKALKIEKAFDNVDLEELNDEDFTKEMDGIKNKLYQFVDEHKLAPDFAKQQKEEIDQIAKEYDHYFAGKRAVKAELTGKMTPVFTAYENIDGSTTSLNDLKGKYVYIDVWATWCGPCKHEIPYLKELEEKYREKNIEFVSISVDKAQDHDKWTKMVKEKELEGIQLFADNSFKSQFIQDYKINSIPRFILIDPQGKIISPDTYRPSEKEKIEKLFEELGI